MDTPQLGRLVKWAGEAMTHDEGRAKHAFANYCRGAGIKLDKDTLHQFFAHIQHTATEYAREHIGNGKCQTG